MSEQTKHDGQAANQQQLAALKDDADAMHRICELLNIGEEARRPNIIMANIENVIRRSGCLSAVEAKFFMASHTDEDDELREECMLPWGASPDEYANEFGDALTAIAAATTAQLSGNSGQLPVETAPDGVTIPRELFIQMMGWIEDRRRYGDEGTLHQVWYDLKAIQRAQQPASAQPVAADPTDENVEREWVRLWRDIVAPNGIVDIAQLKKELADFSMLLEYVPKVYMHVTGGKISKPNTLPDVVCAVADDHTSECFEKYAEPASTQLTTSAGALADIAAERRRQVEAEGWTPEHDDQHGQHTLSSAAGSYAMHTLAYPAGDPPPTWPWAASWWKPSTDPRRNWIKAGALIVAEIERHDRVARAEQKAPPCTPTSPS